MGSMCVKCGFFNISDVPLCGVCRLEILQSKYPDCEVKEIPGGIQVTEPYVVDKTAAPVSALSTQIAGSHYKNLQIQPVEFCQKNKLNYCESAVVKYVCRHREKGGAEDIRKAVHFLELLLELEYQK